MFCTTISFSHIVLNNVVNTCDSAGTEPACQRDYAERVVASFANQIKCELYGRNRSFSIEDIALGHFCAAPLADINSSTLSRPRLAVFHSFLSDDSKQDAATTIVHRKILISLLKNKQVLTTSLSKIWEKLMVVQNNTDDPLHCTLCQ